MLCCIVFYCVISYRIVLCCVALCYRIRIFLRWHIIARLNEVQLIYYASSYRHCIVYDRNLCGSYLNQSMWEYRWTSRYIDSRVGLNQTESTVLKFMNQIEKIDPSFDKCKKILRTLLCQYTLVPCNGRGLPTPYCREDCEALFRQCEKPMIEIMGAAKVILSQLPPSKVSIGFPNCTALKYRHEYPTSSDEKCLHFGLFGKCCACPK